MQVGSRDFIYASFPTNITEVCMSPFLGTGSPLSASSSSPPLKQPCLQRSRQRKPARHPSPHPALPILLLALQIGPRSPLFSLNPTFHCKLFSPRRFSSFATFSPLPSVTSSSISSRPLLRSLQRLRNPKKGRR